MEQFTLIMSIIGEYGVVPILIIALFYWIIKKEDKDQVMERLESLEVWRDNLEQDMKKLLEEK